MKREALKKLNRQASEMLVEEQVDKLARSPCNEHEIDTASVQNHVRGGNEVGKYFRIKSARHVSGAGDIHLFVV
jgi:hypothetical protein